MQYFKWLIFILAITFSGSVSAEYYKYVDQDGNIRYTDDLNQVPQDQRSTVEEYVEYQPDTNRPQASAQNQTASESLNAETPASEDLARIKRQLDTDKQELDGEFQALTEARALLNKEKETVKTQEERATYNQNVTQLNERIQHYEERRKAFNAEVEAFNASVNQADEHPSPTDP